MLRDAFGRPRAQAIVSATMTVAGLVMLLSPLALWIAPDKLTFKLVLLVCIVASGIVILLARIAEPEPGDGPRQVSRPPSGLPEATIERLQNRGEMSRRPIEILRQSEPRRPR